MAVYILSDTVTDVESDSIILSPEIYVTVPPVVITSPSTYYVNDYVIYKSVIVFSTSALPILFVPLDIDIVPPVPSAVPKN